MYVLVYGSIFVSMVPFMWCMVMLLCCMVHDNVGVGYISDVVVHGSIAVVYGFVGVEYDGVAVGYGNACVLYGSITWVYGIILFSSMLVLLRCLKML